MITFGSLDRPPSRKKLSDPGRTGEHLGKEGDFFQQAPAQQFFHAIAVIPFTQSRHRGVDGDHQRRAACHPGAFDHRFGGGTPSHQIELEADGSGGSSLDVFHPMPGDGRENVGCARGTRSPGGARFPIGMHQAAVAHRRQQRGERHVEAQDACPHLAIGHSNRMPRPERDVIKDPAVLSQRDFAISAAVQVIKNRFGQSTPCQGPEILHTDDPRGCHFA